MIPDSHSSCPGYRLLISTITPCLLSDLPHRANELMGLNAPPQGGWSPQHVPITAGHSLRICFLISLEGSSQFCRRRQEVLRGIWGRGHGRARRQKYPETPCRQRPSREHPSLAGQSGSFPSGLGGEGMRPGFTQDWGPGALGLALP